MFTQERDLFERARSFFLGIFDSSGSGMCVYIYIYVCIEGSMRMKERERREIQLSRGNIIFRISSGVFFFLYHSANLNINM